MLFVTLAWSLKRGTAMSQDHEFQLNLMNPTDLFVRTQRVVLASFRLYFMFCFGQRLILCCIEKAEL